MFTRQLISVGNLLLDISNYRIGKQGSQKDARDAIIAEQGKKLVVLAKDIIEHGLNPFDLPLVIDADNGNGSFTVIEGNRRLTAINLMLKPEQAEGTALFASFKKLNREHGDAIPKVLECTIAPSKRAGVIWINRKHQNGLLGAGTEPWTGIAKARADEERGIARPDLDAVNFVLTNEKLDPEVRAKLTGSSFNLSTMKRLVETKEFQTAAEFSIRGGKLVSEQNVERMKAVFTDVVKIIASGIHNGKPFTERDIDSEDKRKTFVESILGKHPKAKKASESWEISGTPIPAKKGKKTKGKTTPSTDEQPNLIPKKFKLELPSGKINDIFVEMKELDVAKRRHAVSVLFRVFIEMTLQDYIAKHGIILPTDGQGRTVDTMKVRLQFIKEHAKKTKLLTDRELKPVSVAIGGNDSILSPDTLNAYVHSPWMNPDPMQLKTTWLNFQLFIERLWTSENTAGQP